ncbi:holin [Enterobacter sp. MF024]|uniref:phage holin family protein n=1 Tax=Enterobacter sp. MF024 TaxID=2555644 RepID=UPI0011061258|nr:phage holin family protein [Enterobacter sp. MF024]TLU70424.1 holin [Enterobacter sp. MF024]
MHGAPPGVFEEQLLKWLVNYLPTFYAAGAALSISALMSLYDGQSLIKTATGSLACGILTLAVAGSLEFFGLPGSAVTFIGASIGFMGAEKLRDKVGGLFCRGQKGIKDAE